MASTLSIPAFETEAEEADWWYENRERVSEEFVRADAEGRLGHGTAVRRALEAQAAVRLDAEDVQRARAAALRHGMTYEDYVKRLVHDALERDLAA